MVTIEPICCIEAWTSLPYWFSERSQFMRLQPRGHWLGTGCKLLNLNNPVRWDPMVGLLQGCIPSRGNVVPRDRHTQNRIAAWRFTFATPIRDLIRWGADPTQIGPIGVTHLKAVTVALNRFDRAITASVDTPPWEYPPTSVFALFRGLPGRHHAGQTGTTAFFINLGFVPDQTAHVYPTETVRQAAECILPTYLEHLAVLQPHPTRVNLPTQIPGSASAQAQATLAQPRQLNIVHRYGHSH